MELKNKNRFPRYRENALLFPTFTSTHASMEILLTTRLISISLAIQTVLANYPHRYIVAGVQYYHSRVCGMQRQCTDFIPGGHESRDLSGIRVLTCKINNVYNRPRGFYRSQYHCNDFVFRRSTIRL